MRKVIFDSLKRGIVFLTCLSLLLASSCVMDNSRTGNNANNDNHLDEFIKIQNEKEANAIRNANYSNLSTNELERRLKEGVKNVR